jgi:hypothetical protein
MPARIAIRRDADGGDPPVNWDHIRLIGAQADGRR